MSDTNPVAKAIADSATDIAIAKAETRKRRKWSYIRAQELKDWAEKNSAVGSDEVLVRAFFNEALKQSHMQRLTIDQQRRLLAKNELPSSFNPEGRVEKGTDDCGVEFFAIWSDKGEPDFPPTF